MVRVLQGDENPLRLFTSIYYLTPPFTSTLPQFNTFCTSFKPQFNPCLAKNLEPQFEKQRWQTVGSCLGCQLPWPFFSRKPPALTLIDRRKSVINPKIASINVCYRPIFCDFLSFSMEILTATPSNWHPQYGLFGTIPGQKGPGNLTPKIVKEFIMHDF